MTHWQNVKVLIFFLCVMLILITHSAFAVVIHKSRKSILSRLLPLFHTASVDAGHKKPGDEAKRIVLLAYITS